LLCVFAKRVIAREREGCCHTGRGFFRCGDVRTGWGSCWAENCFLQRVYDLSRHLDFAFRPRSPLPSLSQAPRIRVHSLEGCVTRGMARLGWFEFDVKSLRVELRLDRLEGGFDIRR